MGAIDIVSSLLQMSAPLMIAALGGLVCERSGIYQLALEAYLLIGAFVAAAVAYWTHSPPLGMLAGIFAAGILSLIQFFWTVNFKADSVVVGMAINLTVIGLIPVLNRLWFSVTTSTPQLTDNLHENVIVLVLLTIVFHIVILQHTVWGLYNYVAGKSPLLIQTLGRSPAQIQFVSVLWSGAMGGFAGSLLSLWLASNYSRNMSAGRGFIALVAMIAGRHRPLPTVAFCLFFGAMELAQMRLGASGFAQTAHIPSELLMALPYLLTLLLAFGNRKKV